MAEYEIYTDSSCDLSEEIINEFQIKVMQLEVYINDEPPVLNNEIEITSFYNLLRKGANAKTAAVTLGQFEESMRKTLQAEKDILYVGFSSGLSATYNNAVMVIKELQQEFSERKICCIDTLCASGGQGLLVYYAAQLKKRGIEIEAVYEKLVVIKDRIHHQVTVDDLFFLKRGGRISATTAVAGTVLSVKPIIHMDKEGHLQNVSKVRGRRKSVKELFVRMRKNAALDELPYVFITHSDCFEDANDLASMIKEEYENAQIIISCIGPVIGAHTGPGGLALCYLGKTMKGC